MAGGDYEESNISDEQLENVYLPPFHAAVKAGAGSLMSAYMDLNGVPATGNKWLLHDVLRERWGVQRVCGVGLGVGEEPDDARICERAR